MKNVGVPVLALALGLTSVASRAFAQASQSAGAASFNIRLGAVAELKEAENELVSLAQAMPADKYTWRPAEGVRSVAEVYLHVCAGNFGLTAMAGAPPKAGFKFQGYEKSTTEKAQILAQLNDCFAFAENGISNLSDADLSKSINWPAYPTVGDLILHIVAHAHEHLGQSIAYARMNGIVPPWTAAAQQRRAQGQQPPAPRPQD
ncbi:MAG TPA: DinB family protein [Candidatus Acidoferrales bacterium]|nr:DinB family protein [Candidatus Acidoferrales bacterium]